MRTLVQRLRDRLLSTRDTVCLDRARLVTEAWQRFADEPPALRRAHAFAHVLEHMQLDLDTNPVFAGNTSSRARAWMLIPEHGFGVDAQIALENEGLDGILDGAVPASMLEFWERRSFGGHSGIGHLAVDLHRVVHDGLAGIIAELDQCADDGDREQCIYRQAMRVAVQAVVDWAGRYARAASEAAASTDDPALAGLHRRVAAACRRVPAKPARDLFEALQAMVLVHLAIAIEGHGMSISLGLPDRVLEPFIGSDFDADSATELIGAMLLKIASNSYQGHGSKTQAITVGGVDSEGRDRSNALTHCFLAACNEVRLGDPHLFLRWHAAIDPAVKQRAAVMLAAGLSMPLLVHDEPTAQGFLDAGASPGDAWNYCVIGCNELGIPGCCMDSATAMHGSTQYVDILTNALVELPAPDAVTDMDAFLDCMEETMHRRALAMRRNGEARRQRLAEAVPTPFTSALMRHCVRRGEDLLTGMDYHFPGIYERGLTNAVNALAAIDHLVFRTGRLGLRALVDAMRENFADQRILQQLLQAPKWGNDDERADRWATELLRRRDRVLDAIDARFGGRRHMSCHVVRSLHHLDGRRLAASPDGRLAGTPLADSVGAETGTAMHGPTAMLRSVLRLDAARHFRGGYNLNVTLPRADTKPAVIEALIEGFFAEGGQELQINCLDAAVLRDAREHPQQHQDLVVRVAGLSARFVDLARVEQDELIARADACA